MNCWIIVANHASSHGLVAVARALGGRVTVAALGPRELAESAAAAGPDTVRWYANSRDLPPEALAAAVASDALADNVDVVLGAADPSSRVVTAVVAARLGAATVSGVTGVSLGGGSVVLVRPVCDGKALERIEADLPVALVLEPEDVGAEAPVAPIVEVAATPTDGVRVREGETDADVQASGLVHADRVVGIGMGLRRKADLVLVEQLAEAADAAVACSLPVSEDMRWFDSSHVVGSSSQRIAPALYLAVGISGQPQHLAGVRGSRVIAAINSDADAPIFQHCQYGIVGDLYQILPALTEALSS